MFFRVGLCRGAVVSCQRDMASSVGDGDEKPVQFSKSAAFKYRPELSFGAEDQSADRLWIEPYVIIFSLGAFMLYFFVLREESDIDDRLGRDSLEQQLRKYEIEDIRKAIEKCKVNHVDSTELEDKLEELIFLDKVSRR